MSQDGTLPKGSDSSVGLSMKRWVTGNSLCRPSWSELTEALFLCLPGAGNKGVSHSPGSVSFSETGSKEALASLEFVVLLGMTLNF